MHQNLTLLRNTIGGATGKQVGEFDCQTVFCFKSQSLILFPRHRKYQTSNHADKTSWAVGSYTSKTILYVGLPDTARHDTVSRQDLTHTCILRLVCYGRFAEGTWISIRVHDGAD